MFFTDTYSITYNEQPPLFDLLVQATAQEIHLCTKDNQATSYMTQLAVSSIDMYIEHIMQHVAGTVVPWGNAWFVVPICIATDSDIKRWKLKKENAPTTRIFCKIRHFLVPRVQLWKINWIIKQNCGFLFGTPGYSVVHHILFFYCLGSSPCLENRRQNRLRRMKLWWCYVSGTDVLMPTARWMNWWNM